MVTIVILMVLFIIALVFDVSIILLLLTIGGIAFMGVVVYKLPLFFAKKKG